MKITENFLGLKPDDPGFEIGKIAMKWTAVGMSAVALGLGSKAIGIKEGLDLLYSGIPVTIIGGTALRDLDSIVAVRRRVDVSTIDPDATDYETQRQEQQTRVFGPEKIAASEGHQASPEIKVAAFDRAREICTEHSSAKLPPAKCVTVGLNHPDLAIVGYNPHASSRWLTSNTEIEAGEALASFHFLPKTEYADKAKQRGKIVVWESLVLIGDSSRPDLASARVQRHVSSHFIFGSPRSVEFATKAATTEELETGLALVNQFKNAQAVISSRDSSLSQLVA